MMHYIPLHQTHADVLSGMHRVCFQEPWSPQDMREILSMPGCGGVLAAEDGSLVPSQGSTGPAGFVIWRMAADEAEILSIAVLPPWRRRHLGHDLLETAVRFAAERGASAMFLEVALDNMAARQLYQSSGFTQVGIRKAYYNGADALVLRTDL